jgi:uncharacterized Zn ribbon protein
VSKFKVGDKVRVISLVDSEDEDFDIDDIFIIQKVFESNLEGYWYYNNASIFCYESELELVESKKEENSDITKDLKKAIGFLDLHDKDQFMLDNIVATLEDRINEISVK